MSWTAPTYRSAHALSDNPTVRCARCGRRTSADMLTDIRALPAHLRAHFGDAEYVCDACRERSFGLRQMSRHDFFVGLGAPREALEHLAAFEARRKAAG